MLGNSQNRLESTFHHVFDTHPFSLPQVDYFVSFDSMLVLLLLVIRLLQRLVGRGSYEQNNFMYRLCTKCELF